MTSHELAKLLLSGPDIDVCYWKYTGGDDELLEVQSVEEYSDDYTPKKIVLNTY